MSKKEIIIEIDESGNCNMEGVGFVGAECDQMLAQIHTLLGQAQNIVKKPEYNQRLPVQNRLRNRN